MDESDIHLYSVLPGFTGKTLARPCGTAVAPAPPTSKQFDPRSSDGSLRDGHGRGGRTNPMASVCTRVGSLGISLLAVILFLSSSATELHAQLVPAPASSDLVLHAAAASAVAGNWTLVNDAAAASGRRTLNRDGGLGIVGAPVAARSGQLRCA